MALWYPRKTVAVIVEQQDNLKDPLRSRFLMVEEHGSPETLFNQPAGHLDPDESLLTAARREALEESAWDVELTGFLGLYHYMPREGEDSYIRSCFVARAVRHHPERALDPDIVTTHWLSLAELEQRQARLRSPLVMPVIRDYLASPCWPLDVVRTLGPPDLAGRD